MTTPTQQVDRVVVGSLATLSFAPLDEDGEPITIDTPGEGDGPTVSIVDGAGTAKVEAASASIDEDSGALTYALDPDDFAEDDGSTLLDTFTVTWTAKVSAVTYSWSTALELCGGRFFELPVLRSGRREFENKPAAVLRAARDLAESQFEEAAHVAFVPRGAREVIKGDGTRTLLLAHVAIRTIHSVSITTSGVTTALTAAEIAALDVGEAGVLKRPLGSVWPDGSDIAVWYEHGYDGPDLGVSDAVLKLAQDRVITDPAVPSRAVLELTDFGNFRLATPDAENPFGIPAIDSVVKRVRRRKVGR